MEKPCIGLRREDKSVWERRVAVTPEDARALRAQGLEVWAQPSLHRVFTDSEMEAAGVRLSEDLCACPVVLGIKEMPPDYFHPGGVYVFFSHTTKGQLKNMKMLQSLMERGGTLIDYEKIVDEEGRRLVFFGRFAGLAGMVETLWALGRRLQWEGYDTPLARVRHAYQYRDLEEVRQAMARLGAELAEQGLPPAVSPLIVGVAGYGNVGRGALEILDLLPALDIPADDVPDLARRGGSRFAIYRSVFREADTVEPVEPGASFDLADFRLHPQRYGGVFERFLPHLTAVVNCVYWEPRFPRLISKEFLRRHWLEDRPRLRVIGDISADLEGSIEATVRITEPGSPVYVYDPLTGRDVEGVEGRGPVIMAVDILPSELPRDSSVYFSQVLRDFIPAIARADYSVGWEELDLPPAVKRAVIVYQGRLTPSYEYLDEYLQNGSGGRTGDEEDSGVGCGDGGWSARAVPARAAGVSGHRSQQDGRQGAGGGGGASAR